MPPRKKRVATLGPSTAKAKRMKILRAAEAEEERDRRLEADRVRTAASRAAETDHREVSD